MKAPDALDRDWVRRSLSGPISAVHPLFERDGSLDFAGLRNEIEHNLAAGSGVMLLTYGDSLHSLLSDAEVGELLRAVVEQTRRRAMVVAGDRQWWTGQEIAFADFAREAGADLLMVLPPNFGASATHDTLVAHYRAVADHIPVMPVTGLFATNHALGLRVLGTLVDTAPNVVAVKDDVVGVFARRMTALVHERWPVLSGGQKQNHLDLHPYGVTGYMSTYLHFMPEIAHAYWRAIQANDVAAAAAMVAAYDTPWFELAFASDGNFDGMFHASQELFGIGGRWRRPPYHSFTDDQVEALRAFYDGLPRLADVVPAYAEGPTPAPAGRP